MIVNTPGAVAAAIMTLALAFSVPALAAPPAVDATQQAQIHDMRAATLRILQQIQDNRHLLEAALWVYDDKCEPLPVSVLEWLGPPRDLSDPETAGQSVWREADMADAIQAKREVDVLAARFPEGFCAAVKQWLGSNR